jgi:gag-polyprotein putative aspartyl protease
MRVHLFAAAIGLLVCHAARADTPDYYSPRARLDADSALLLDAASGNDAVIDRLRARLRAMPEPANAADGWSFLCSFDYHTGRYEQALSDCADATAADPNGSADTFAIVKLVAREPTPRVQGSARVPIKDDMRIPVRAGDYNGDAVADTGAEISVMMQSVARKAHVRLLGPSRNVQGTTAGVTGEIGLLPRVAIGGAAIENIPVLVLPDAQLVLTSGKVTLRLPFILSLYAMADFGRIAFLDHCKVLALGAAAPASFPGATPMIWHPAGIAVPLQGPGGIHAAHFDSGANVSYLYPAALPLLAEKERARIGDNMRKIGGVGGVVEEKIQRLPLANFALAGQPLIFQNIDIAAQPASGEAARLGQDVLRDYATVVFDFGAMTVSVAH